MVAAAVERGWMDRERTILETLTGTGGPAPTWC